MKRTVIESLRAALPVARMIGLIIGFVAMVWVTNYATYYAFGRKLLARSFIRDAIVRDIRLIRHTRGNAKAVFLRMGYSDVQIVAEITELKRELECEGVVVFIDFDSYYRYIERSGERVRITKFKDAPKDIKDIVLWGGAYEAIYSVEIPFPFYAEAGIGYGSSPRNGFGYSARYIWVIWRWYRIGPAIGGN